MSYSQYFLPNLIDMGSLLGTMLGAILNHKGVPMSIFHGPLIKQILTVGHNMGILLGHSIFYLLKGDYKGAAAQGLEFTALPYTDLSRVANPLTSIARRTASS